MWLLVAFLLHIYTLPDEFYQKVKAKIDLIDLHRVFYELSEQEYGKLACSFKK
jgi:hypothetical protein